MDPKKNEPFMRANNPFASTKFINNMNRESYDSNRNMFYSFKEMTEIKSLNKYKELFEKTRQNENLTRYKHGKSMLNHEQYNKKHTPKHELLQMKKSTLGGEKGHLRDNHYVQTSEAVLIG